MKKPKRLEPGDKIAIVSLSSGMLGEAACAHNLEIGLKRLEAFGITPVIMPYALKGLDFVAQHPEARADDLKAAFADPTINAIICAIGGDDTYRLLPYLMEDEAFKQTVKQYPKIFTGFSDTTINHLMFYQLGLTTYYGPSFITDVGEIANHMLPYTEQFFLNYFEKKAEISTIEPSPVWYEERTDFSRQAIGNPRVSHTEAHGFELLQGAPIFEGRLLGGCLESLYDILTTNRYPDEKAVCAKYQLFPSLEKWTNKLLFIETCEEKPTPETFEQELLTLKAYGLFDVVAGVLVGKPQDEAYYESYKSVLLQTIDTPDLPVLYNVNFGHALPRCTLPYGLSVKVNAEEQCIVFQESLFAEA